MERYEPIAQSVYNGPVPKSLNARKMRMPNKVPKITADEVTSILAVLWKRRETQLDLESLARLLYRPLRILLIPIL